MQYATEQLPWQDFAVLGLDRMAVLSLPQPTLNSLLSGNRTSLMRFEKVKIPGLSGNYPIDGKLSLKKNDDGSLNLLVHPVHKTLENRFDLSDKEVRMLKKDERAFIPKLVAGVDGKLEEALVTIDHSTNELVAVKREGLKAPDRINGVTLNATQKKDFVSGNPLTIDNKPYILNPNNEAGLSGPDVISIEAGHGKYRQIDFAADSLLLTAGLGHYVMLWHLANVLLHTRVKHISSDKNLQNIQFRNGLAEAQKEILQKQELLSRQNLNNGKNEKRTLTIDEIKEILEKKAGEHISIEKVTTTDMEEDGGKQEVKAVQKEDDPKNKLSIEDEKPRNISFKM